MDFDLLKRAGISDIDLAGLLGVSKAAVNFWRTGKSKPHPLRKAKVDRYFQLVAAAVDAKALPVEFTASPSERLEKIKVVLRQYVDA